MNMPQHLTSEQAHVTFMEGAQELWEVAVTNLHFASVYHFSCWSLQSGHVLITLSSFPTWVSIHLMSPLTSAAHSCEVRL